MASSARGATATRPGQALTACADYADTRPASIQVAVLSLAIGFFCFEHMPSMTADTIARRHRMECIQARYIQRSF
jgi:hypothetical protein